MILTGLLMANYPWLMDYPLLRTVLTRPDPVGDGMEDGLMWESLENRERFIEYSRPCLGNWAGTFQ